MTHLNKKINNIFAIAQNELDSRPARSAWAKGVMTYARELLKCLRYEVAVSADPMAILSDGNAMDETMRVGATSWCEYSWNGCALIFDSDIAERLCSPSELKRTCYGQRKPNSREYWLDTQARALFQASHSVIEALQNALALAEESEIEEAEEAVETPTVTAVSAVLPTVFTASSFYRDITKSNQTHYNQ